MEQGILRIVIEGYIYQVQAHGGISRIFNETLPRLCAMDKQARVTILTDGTSMQPLPAGPSISCQHGDCDPLFRRSRAAIWHCTYFTPAEDWQGAQVCTVYDMIPERFSNFFCTPWDDALRLRRKNAILKADSIIAISRSTESDLVDILGISPDSIHVAHLSHNPLFRRLEPWQRPENPDPPFFLYVGDRNHYKNFTGLLRGFAAWRRSKEAELRVVGKPLSKEEQALSIELGIHDRIKVLGTVSDQDLLVLYNTAAAFVYPSFGEGFGIPLLEAMACGCPVIASDIPSTREVADNCPLYFDPSEPDSLAGLFSEALEIERESERIRIGLERCAEFSWDKTAGRILDIYRSTLASMDRHFQCAFPAGHYYSPIPDLEDVTHRAAAIFRTPDVVTGVDLNIEGQLDLWRAMTAFGPEFPFHDEPGQLRYGMNNPFFGHGDAWSLYGMMRLLQPKRLVEIGSGHSSAAILDINDLFLNGELRATFIDPHPERLLTVLREEDTTRSTIIQNAVQDTDAQIFEQLEANDMLFVDSSHVSKVGSDLNHILFEILPRLKNGVVIHFHDIFYPFEYPRNWIMGGRFWNECYLVRAFLQNNSAYSILLFNSFLARRYEREIAASVPFFLKRDPDNPWVEGCGSIWLIKH